MSLLDFKQAARDQGCLHIVLKPVGATETGSRATVKAVRSVLENMPPVQLPEPKGTVLFLRFIDGEQLPCWAAGDAGTRWDHFSAHKSVLGMLCIAQCHDADELDDIRAGYRDACSHHQGLCASKCIVYGAKKQLEAEACIDPKDGFVYIDSVIDELDILPEDTKPQAVERVATELAQSIFSSLKVRLDKQLRAVSESSRNVDPFPPHLKAPTEIRPRDAPEEDHEQKQLSRGNLLGRLQKQIADLYLLLGHLQLAGNWYRTASEDLKHHRDWLWVGGAYEGLSATALMTKECERVLGQKAQGVEAPSSLSKLKVKVSRNQSGSGSVISNRGSSDIRRNRAAGGSTKRGPPKSPSPDLDEEEGGLSVGNMGTSGGGLVIANRSDSLNNFIVDEEGEGEGEGLEDEVDGLKTEEEETMALLIDSRLLHKDFIIDKFTLALVYYRRAGRSGRVLQMELLIKLAKYLVELKHYGKAAELLQQTVLIDCYNHRELLSLYQTMASVYTTMGFQRKAAMFTFYAARLGNKLAKSNIHKILQAHSSLMGSLPGYKLSSQLESLGKTRASHMGWPQLQACILTELVYLSSRLGEDLTVIKHACYLMEMLHQHMTPEDAMKVSSLVDCIVKTAREKCLSSPQYASSVAGKLSSPIPLNHFPLVRSFFPRPLIKMMAPLRREGFKTAASTTRNLPTNELKAEAGGKAEGSGKEGGATNPFIYSPFGPGGRKKTVKRNEILWVVKDPAEMALSISNPLPFELRVENMALRIEGADVEIFPSSLTLPGGSEQSQFVLVSIPRSTGEVKVLGYEATVFGVYHKCDVKITGNPIIRVISKLPQLGVRTFPVLTADGGGAVETGVGGRRTSKAGLEKFELMDGESCQFDFELASLNDGVDITSIQTVVKKCNEDYCAVSWDKESLTSVVPITYGKPSFLRVTIRARIPSWSRFITDLGSSRPASRPPVSSDTAPGGSSTLPRHGGNFMNELVPPAATSGKTTPTHSSSITPNSSPIIKRGFPGILGHHRRKASNEGLEHLNPRARNTSLMDSLNLDTPLHMSRNSSTLPNLAGRGSAAGSAGKNYNMIRSWKTKGGYTTKGGTDLDYDDVIFGLDKRASIRSDPGDREHGKSRKTTLGGSSHTSPTSSIGAIPSSIGGSGGDVTQPISIPQAGHLTDHHGAGSPGTPAAKVGSDLVNRNHQGVARNISLQGRSSVKVRPGINKGNISLPTGPVYKEVVSSLKKMRVMGEFAFEYSGGQGAEEGYYRITEANFSVFVKPCLLIEQLDISSSDKSLELFQLTFTIHNVSIHKLKITLTVNQAGVAECGGTASLEVSLEASSCKKCTLLIRKFNLDSESLDTSRTKAEIHLVKQYSKQLVEMLRVDWIVEEEGEEEEGRRRGTISLDGLRLPVASIPLMKPLPILFGVKLNQEDCSPSESTHSRNLGVGSMINASIKLTNNSPSTMPASFLVLEPYTFSQEGRTIVRNLTGKMLHSGGLVTNVPQLPSGTNFEHQVSMSFLCKGHFLMDIKLVVPAVTKGTLTSDPEGSPRKSETTRSPVKKMTWKSKLPTLNLPQQAPSQPSPEPAPQIPPLSTPQTPPVSTPKTHPESTPQTAPLSVPKTPPMSAPSASRTPGPVMSQSLPVTSPLSLSPPNSPDSSRPVSAKALARKFEMLDEQAKKESESIRKPPSSPKRSHLYNGDPAVVPKTEGSSSETPPQAPPPVPTSSRPSFSRKSPSDVERKRSYTTHIEPVNLAKPIPVSSSLSASSSTSFKSPTASSAVPVRSLRKKTQSSVLLSSQSKYQNLLRDRPSGSSTVKVTSGPNFSFYVS